MLTHLLYDLQTCDGFSSSLYLTDISLINLSVIELIQNNTAS